MIDEDKNNVNATIIAGGGKWHRERWWYKLAQVCRRWRILILESASYLNLFLVCTPGTPVADMLANSPPLPLIIDYDHTDWDISAEEEKIILALKQRDRVSRVRIWFPVPNLQKVIMAMEEEYPILGYLILGPSTDDNSTALMLPETFQAPRLYHLLLTGFALPIGSQLLTTAVALIRLILIAPHPSAFFPPNNLLRWLSFMPQLEVLEIHCSFPDPSHEDVLMHTLIPACVTLPNFCSFMFQGDDVFMNALVHRISTPCLKSLVIPFLNQPTFLVPHFLRFMNPTGNFRFNHAKFKFFGESVCVDFYHHEAEIAAEWSDLRIYIGCWHLDWQVTAMAQIFNHTSSTVEHLSLEHNMHSWSSEEHNEVDITVWRQLLRSFSNVKTLRVDDGLVKELTRTLRLDDGKHPLELLPELQELTYPGSGDTDDTFASFIDSRQNAGRPVTLVCSSPRPVTTLS